MERTGSIDVIYRFDGPVTGRGLIEAEWTDTVGRVVERRRIPLDLAGAAEAVFSLDPKRAVTVKNKLAVHVSLDETDQSGKPVHREHEETASFIVSPPDNAWSDYQIIMWQRQTPAGYAALKRLGITAGMVESDRSDKPGSRVMDQVDAMLDADLRWYLENIATDFYSPYHRWSADRPVNWRFLEAKRALLGKSTGHRGVCPRAEPFRPGMARQDQRPFDRQRERAAPIPTAFLQFGG